MYRYRVIIYNDGEATTIHEASVDPADPHLYSCTLTEGSPGEIDSLQFTILPNNPGYDLLNSRTTLIEVVRLWTDDGTLAVLGKMILGQAVLGRGEEEIVFSGRVLTMTPEMEENGLIYKSIVCESRLGYLCDSIQPYLAKDTYWGNDERTGVEQYLDLVLENHNAQVEDYKKIYRGNVTFHTSTDNVTKGLTYESTWSTISSKLLNDLGGEMQLREGDDGLLYLDYVEELGTQFDEPVIEFARNMRSISCEIDPTSVITRLIPLGASQGSTTTENETEDDTTTETEDGDYLTIAEVNDGVIYLDDADAQAKYGIVEGVVQWSDVTQANNLLRKAKAWLAAQSFTDSITLSAVDLNLIGIDAGTIERYNYYRVINKKIGLDDYLRVIKKTTNICDPSDITYEMGGRKHTLSGTLADASSTAENATKALLTTSTTFKLKEAAIYTEIENSAATIKSDIAAEYVQIVETKDEEGNVVAGYSTTGDIYNAITQTVNASESSILSQISTKYATSDSVNNLNTTVEEVASSAITDSVTEYYKSTSSDTCTGGEWTTDTPAWEEGYYIWIRTTVTTGTGDSKVSVTSEPVCITGNTGAQGEKGEDGADGTNGSDGADGRGIVSTAVYYAVTETGTYYPSFGDDGTTAVLGVAVLGKMVLGNSGQWTTEIPEITDGQYLWTLTIFTYSDDTTDKIYTVSKAGETGAQGEQGIQGLQGLQGDQGEQGIQGEAGADGKSSYFHIKFSSMESPTSSDEMTETPSTYIGTYVDYTEDDSTDPADYTWVKWIGEDGAQGIPGTDGKDGTTYYLHIAYANSEDGTTDFSVDDSTDKSYIGQYTDTEADDSTDPTKYAWTKIKGEAGANGKDGNDGADGVSVKSITAYYAVTESATYYPSHGDDGTTAVLGAAVLGQMVLGNSGKWYTEQPTVGSTEYLWVCFLITYSNGLTSWTEPYCMTDPSTREAVEELEYTLTHNYSTTTEMNAAIEQKISDSEASIKSEITANYVKIDTTTITDSDGNTTEIGSLTTTVEIYNAIQQLVSESANSISLEVTEAKSLAKKGISAYTPYYAVSQSSTYYPSHGDDGTTAVLGAAVLGQMILGNSGKWTEEQPTISDGEYCWVSYYIEYNSGESEWTDPTLLTDTVARDGIEEVSASLVLEIATDSSGNKYGKISANADYVEFDTGDLIISSKQLTLDESGNATYSGALVAASGTFAGELVAATGTFYGDVYADNGYFAGTLAANIVTASNIQDAAVTNAAIAAAAVTNSSIASNAVTYDKISVSTLSSISADVGTLTAGVIQSSNYESGNAGVYIDLTNGTAEFSGDVRATSFSLGSAVFSVESTYITEKNVDANGNITSSISPYNYLKLTTGGSEGLVADAITVTYLGATTAYADGLHSQYIYTKYTINTENISVRNKVDAWTLTSRTGSFTQDLGAAYATIDDLIVTYSASVGTTLSVTGATTLGSTLTVSGDANFNTSVGITNSLTVLGYIECPNYNDLTSDERLKTDWIDISAYDGFFDSLEPAGFHYIYETDRYHMGMSAQKVIKALKKNGLTEDDFAGVSIREKTPDDLLYHGVTDEYRLNYIEFVPLTIYEVQQNKKKIATLESLMEMIQKQIASLYEMQASA